MAVSTLSLLDCCLPVVAYLSWLSEVKHEEEAGPVRTRFEILFRDLDQEAQELGYNQEEVRFAMFALVAAIDERLMNLDWAGRTAWFREPLQLVFFDTNAAGEEFYLRLDQVRERIDDGRLRMDVLEVYHAMLALGLRGQLGATLALRKQRDDLIQELEEQITRLRPRDTVLAGVDAEAPQGNILRRRVWLPPVIIAAVLALFVGGLWIWLYNASSSAVAILGGGQ